MATLNVKNVPESLYRKLQRRARREHRSVAQEVIHILTRVTESSPPASILDLRGLGKETWSQIDTAKHVASERKSWE